MCPAALYAYYFTFANTDGSAFPSVTNDQLDLFSGAVQAALPSVSPFAEAMVDVWVQVGNSTASVEIGLAFSDIFGEPIDVDLTSIFARNASTTALIAKALVEVVMQAGGDSAGRLAAGLSIASSDGAQNVLETAITVGEYLLAGFTQQEAVPVFLTSMVSPAVTACSEITCGTPELHGSAQFKRAACQALVRLL